MNYFIIRLKEITFVDLIGLKNNLICLDTIIVVHALLTTFRATIFFALQAQTRFKQAAIV